MRYRGWLRKADMPTPKLTTEIITAAIEGFASQKRRIDDQITELRLLLPDGSSKIDATPKSPTGRRKKFSAAARKRMKEAQQRRWAKVRGESQAAKAEPAKPKRKLSAAAKAKRVANLKKERAAKAAKAAKANAAATKVAPAQTAVKKAPGKHGSSTLTGR